MICDCDVDICAPGWLHAEIAVTALNAGKHVLVEKPLANNSAEAEGMVTAAQLASRISGRRVPRTLPWRTVLVFDDNSREAANFSDLVYAPPAWTDD